MRPVIQSAHVNSQHGTCQRCGQAVYAGQYIGNLPPDPGRFTCTTCLTPEETKALAARMLEAQEREAGQMTAGAAGVHQRRALVSTFEKARKEHAERTKK